LLILSLRIYTYDQEYLYAETGKSPIDYFKNSQARFMHRSPSASKQGRLAAARELIHCKT